MCLPQFVNPFSSAFPVAVEMIILFFSHYSINVVNYTGWFSDVKPTLHSQDKPHWSWCSNLLNDVAFDLLKFYSRFLCLCLWRILVLTLFFLKLFYCCSVIVVCIFSPPLPPTPAIPTSLPCFHPSPWSCPCVLYNCSGKPFPLIIPSHLPSGYCQIVLNFNVSGYILLAFFFCWLCSC